MYRLMHRVYTHAGVSQDCKRRKDTKHQMMKRYVLICAICSHLDHTVPGPKLTFLHVDGSATMYHLSKIKVSRFATNIFFTIILKYASKFSLLPKCAFRTVQF